MRSNSLRADDSIKSEVLQDKPSMIASLIAMGAYTPKKIRDERKVSVHPGGFKNAGASQKILELVSVKPHTINDIAHTLSMARTSTAALVANLRGRVAIKLENVNGRAANVVRAIGMQDEYVHTGIIVRAETKRNVQ